MKIIEAYGIIKMADGTTINLDGNPFDIMTIKEPNDIVAIGEGPEFSDANNIIFVFENGNKVTFPEYNGVKLFIAHNQMLTLKGHWEGVGGQNKLMLKTNLQ